jgi:hypothetical protein
VSATFRDGFRSAGTLTITGRHAVAKARRCGELVLLRVREAGFDLRDSIVECLGSGDADARLLGHQRDDSERLTEAVLRVAAEADSREGAERFAEELMPLITAGPQGTTGYAEGRPRVHPVFRYWPCLIDRNAVTPKIEFVTSVHHAGGAPLKTCRDEAVGSREVLRSRSANSIGSSARALGHPTHLYDIAVARSGDKGTSANVGVICREGRSWEFLRTWLTAERVAEYFSAQQLESVERFELPNLNALNFVLHGALRRALRTDAQGKAIGQMILEMRLPNVMQAIGAEPRHGRSQP